MEQFKIQTEFKNNMLVLDKGYDIGVRKFGNEWIAFAPKLNAGMLGKTYDEALNNLNGKL